MRFINGESVLDSDINLSGLAPSIFTALLSWSPDGSRLALKTADGVYHFDKETGSLESLSSDSALLIRLFWSADSRYLTFQSGEGYTIWNAENNSSQALAEDISAIIGWRDAAPQNSLVCLRGYSDGDA
jgi:Tol biopolymer transport system component